MRQSQFKLLNMKGSILLPMYNYILKISTVILICIISNSDGLCQSKLVLDGSRDKAEEKCKKKDGVKRDECYTEMAKACLILKDYIHATLYYRYADNMDGLNNLADIYMKNESYKMIQRHRNVENASELYCNPPFSRTGIKIQNSCQF